MAIARKSSAEKPLCLVAVSLTASEVVVARIVWPSGAAPLTALCREIAAGSAAIFHHYRVSKPLAELLSDHRATTSAMPPAAKATWNVMVCVGKVCAETGCARPMALATSNRQRMVRKADSACGIIPVFSAMDQCACMIA